MNKSHSTNDLLEIICELSEIKSMKVCVKSSINSGITVGAATTLGGLLLGPRGLAIGGILGGLGASYLMNGSYKSVPEIILKEATPEQKLKLKKSLEKVLRSHNIIDLGWLLVQLSQDKSLLDRIKNIIESFLKTMNYS